MAVSILARLRLARYDAADLRPSVAEWPPHPARVFCALVASATDAADWSALQWLETAVPPQVWATPMTDVRLSRATGFVVTNITELRGGNLTWPGRSNGHKQRVSALPSDDCFALVWPDAEPDDATLGRLVRLASRVPYLGRSTSPVELTVVPEAVPERPSWTAYRPALLGSPGAVQLRVPYPGYLDALRNGYDAGQRAWEFSRVAAYVAGSAGEALSPQPRDVAASPYSDLLIWGITRASVPLNGDLLLAVTDQLRRAVISRIPNPVPAAVTGHGADGRPHVAYLGLPDVGHEHAGGHLLGVGVAVPAGLAENDRRMLLRGLLDEKEPLALLRLPWGVGVDLQYQPERTDPRGLVAQRWTGNDAGARTWSSVTPLMLDRYPKRGDNPADLIARSLVTAGYATPSSVQALPAPTLRGGLYRPRRGTIPEGRPRRPLLHCRVQFPSPVTGPIIAGSLRYLGLGLFAPEHDIERSEDARDS